VDSILVTLSLLGPLYAVYRPIAALITGVGGGIITDALERNNHLGEQAGEADVTCTDSCCEPGAVKEPALKRIWEFGFVTLPRDIGKPLLIGLLIAALISAAVPDGFIPASLGGFWAMLAVLALSIPMYVCATASVPIAAALILAGVSPGAALVFLVAGPATNAATITTLWKILGPRSTVVYLATVAVGAFLGGWALNGLFAVTHLPTMQHGMFMLPVWFNYVAAIVLLGVLANAVWPRRKGAPKMEMELNDNQEQAVLDVKGMDCEHCASSVRNALAGQPGVSNVQVDLSSGTATIVGHGFDLDMLIGAISQAGYQAKRYGSR